jgi:hypothetical protein
MDVTYVLTLSAFAGSAIGGLTTAGATWLTQRAQARAGQLADEMSRRSDLYREFIVAASKCYGDALTSSEPRIADFVGLHAMISRMRVLSSAAIIACAEKIMHTIVDTYSSPNKSVHELGELIEQGSAIEALKDFSEAAREEMHLFGVVQA